MKIFTARIRKFRGKAILEILGKTKESKGSFFACYRETLDGKRTCKNLYFTPMSGYYTSGTPNKDWSDYILKNSPKVYNCSRPIYDKEIEILSEFDTDFKYIAKKNDIDIFEAFRMFHFRKEHPEMELLLSMGFRNLAQNKNFYKFSKQKQKSIINYYLDYERKLGISPDERRYAMLIDIQGAMKEKVSPKAYNSFRYYAKNTNLDIKTVSRLTNKNIGIHDYYSYSRKLFRYFPERLQDDYWTKFKDCQDFHEKENRINEQVDRIQELEDLHKLKEQQKRYTAAIRHARWQCEYNGLTVYVPKKMEDIMNQAKKLKQCLISNDYPSMVINKDIYLIFIKKGDEPLATAELIRKNMTIGQFYGNELDRNNCLPTQECKDALDYFMNKFVRNCA